ncbi:hypothetical protein XENTR_v10009171 [Xenopus tropicalis]|nr:hypothetical protein XENTR_v10009171 [Xenopus tropicalis]
MSPISWLGYLVLFQSWDFYPHLSQQSDPCSWCSIAFPLADFWPKAIKSSTLSYTIHVGLYLVDDSPLLSLTSLLGQ